MTAIRISLFKGEATGVTPRQIPEGYAQAALDADLIKGTLRPVRYPGSSAEDTGLPAAQSIYRYSNGKWLAWSDPGVDVVRSPLANDPWDRIYWSGDGAPKVAAVDVATAGSAPYPNEGYNLGIPVPSTVLIASAPAGNPPSQVVNATYAYAYVTAYDEVGPLSGPSNVITRWDGGGDPDITITTESLPNSNIDRLRIYRSEGGGSFNYVTDLPIGTTNFTDNVQSDELLLAANSVDWIAPPSDLQGLMVGPGDSLYGFYGNKLCASEPGYPHAWPVEYRKSFQDDIVAIAECAIGIVVATTGAPAIVVGSVPSVQSRIKIENREPCVSKHSMVDMGDYVVYASPNGLVGVGNQGANLMTERLLQEEEWQKLNPSSIHAYRDRDRYLAFYTDLEANSGCFAFSPDRGFEFMNITAQAAHYVGEQHKLFIHDGNAQLKVWDEGATGQANWISGIYEVQPGTSFTCCKLMAENYPVTLNGYADGELAYSRVIANSGMHRLVSGHRMAREWEFEVVTDHEVFSLQVAQSPGELI